MSQSTDPIADMLSRVRNAISANKAEISLPHSKIKESVARLLADAGFINEVNVKVEPVGKSLRLKIYDQATNSRINEIVRLSKPGRRYYVNAQKIPIVKRGRGIVILSTSRGLMTGQQAVKEKIGGELICKVY